MWAVYNYCKDLFKKNLLSPNLKYFIVTCCKLYAQPATVPLLIIFNNKKKSNTFKHKVKFSFLGIGKLFYDFIIKTSYIHVKVLSIESMLNADNLSCYVVYI